MKKLLSAILFCLCSQVQGQTFTINNLDVIGSITTPLIGMLYGQGSGVLAPVTIGSELIFSGGILSSTAVSSINVSGGTTGLTATGGPVTGAGTITLGGTLAIANGGTGNTTGNAVTVTTNANLTGDVTSVGNATTLATVGTAGTFGTVTVNAKGLATSGVVIAPLINGGTGNATGLATSTNALQSATTTVNVSSATAPTSGQVLTATGGSAATWQNAGTGTVTSVSGTALNGFTPSVANPTTTPAITLAITGPITPTTVGGIVGTTLGDNAQAGSVGEFLTATSSAVGVTSGTTTNIITLALTAGDWDVTGFILFQGASTTTSVIFQSAVNTVSATLPAVPMYAAYFGSPLTNASFTQTPPVLRVSLAAPATVYLVASTTFSVSTSTVSGVIRARRVR